MKKLKIGDRVQLVAHPKVKSTITKMKPSHWVEDTMIYHLQNGCQCERDEIRRIK